MSTTEHRPITCENLACAGVLVGDWHGVECARCGLRVMPLDVASRAVKPNEVTRFTMGGILVAVAGWDVPA